MPKRKASFCSCGEKLEISFVGDNVQYPVSSCQKCGIIKNDWVKWWQNYQHIWKIDEKWDSTKDKVSCLVGFFCDYFYQFYNRPYVFEYANPIPFKDKEFVMARRILAMFEGNAREARTYIKWVFAKRVKPRNYSVTSIGFFASANFVNEYFGAKEKAKILKRCSKLPPDFIQWCVENHAQIFEKQELSTWNDLNGLVTHIISYGEDNIEGTIVKEAVRRGMLKDTKTYKKLEE